MRHSGSWTHFYPSGVSGHPVGVILQYGYRKSCQREGGTLVVKYYCKIREKRQPEKASGKWASWRIMEVSKTKLLVWGVDVMARMVHAEGGFAMAELR
jgi:hypothetical protein